MQSRTCIFQLSVLACLASLLTLSCRDGSVKQQSAQSDPYQLTIVSGGGFTGVTTGYNLYHDGKVEFWQRSVSGKDTLLWTRNVSPDQIHQFHDQLHGSSVLQKELHEAGNMTTTVMYKTPEAEKIWSWGEQSNVPQELLNWHNVVQKFCSGLASKKD